MALQNIFLVIPRKVIISFLFFELLHLKPATTSRLRLIFHAAEAERPRICSPVKQGYLPRLSSPSSTLTFNPSRLPPLLTPPFLNTSIPPARCNNSPPALTYNFLHLHFANTSRPACTRQASHPSRPDPSSSHWRTGGEGARKLIPSNVIT